MHPEQATLRFTEILQAAMTRFIPRKQIAESKFTHPWLTSTCLELVKRKHEAQGTARYKQAVRDCSSGLLNAYYNFVNRTRERLRRLGRGNKKFWKLSRLFLHKPGSNSTIPALKYPDGS